MRNRRAVLSGAGALLLLIGCAATASPDERRYYEVYRDEKGEWRWRFVGGNGRIIATSHDGYKTEQACRDAIEKIKRSAEANVRKVEEPSSR